MKCRPVLLLLLTTWVVGCSRGPSSSTNESRELSISKTYQGSYTIRAVCTNGMVADLVRQVGGPRLEVEQLIPQDADPHQYKANPDDVSKLSGADIIFYSGLHLEGKMGEVLGR